MYELEFALRIHRSIPFFALHRSEQIKLPTERIILELEGHSNKRGWTEEEKELWELWKSTPKHETLMKLLEVGLWPVSELVSDSEVEIPTLVASLLNPTEREFSLPIVRFSPIDSEVIAPAEEELAYAASMILHKKSIGCWKHQKIADVMHLLKKLDLVVVDWIQQFSIPAPEEGAARITGQLWIIRVSETELRLVVLCVDDETEDETEEAIQGVSSGYSKNAVYLSSLGYELFSTVKWWASVDPWRVMFAFLARAELLPGILAQMSGSELRFIRDYVCAYCHEPMIRWDDDWIEEITHEEQVYRVHQHCSRGLLVSFADALEDRWEDEEEWDDDF